MQRSQDSAERQDLTQPAEGSTTTTNYDDTDQCRTDVSRIRLACKEAEFELEVLKQTLSWEKDTPNLRAGHTSHQLVPGIVRLLKSLAVVLTEHRDDVTRQLQQTTYCTIFADETSERREAVQSVIEKLHDLHQIGPDTYEYDQMINSSWKYATSHSTVCSSRII